MDEMKKSHCAYLATVEKEEFEKKKMEIGKSSKFTKN